MAIIVEQHVVADHYPVGGTAITAGMLVSFTSSLVIPAVNGTTTAIGVAGDSALTSEGQTTAYSAQVTIGANGAATRWTENRVSDFYDETKASQRVTVYTGGGKFWISTDLIDSSAAIATGNLMQVGGTSGYWASGAGTGPNDHVGTAVSTTTAYPSGVPGTDTTDGSITLGNFIAIILRL